MTQENVEVRKIPKKHMIAIIIVILVGIAYYIVSSQLRADKLEEILGKLGHPNVTDVTVYKVHKVEDPEVKKKGTLYSLKFKDLNTNQECNGFVLYDYKHQYSKDLDCN